VVHAAEVVGLEWWALELGRRQSGVVEEEEDHEWEGEVEEVETADNIVDDEVGAAHEGPSVVLGAAVSCAANGEGGAMAVHVLHAASVADGVDSSGAVDTACMDSVP